MKKKTLLITSILLTASASPVLAVSLSDVYLNGSSVTTANQTNILSTFLQPIISNFSIIAGIIALLFMLFAGFRYITSAGNADETQKASNMLTYSLIGLGISALAYWVTRILFQVGGPKGLF